MRRERIAPITLALCCLLVAACASQDSARNAPAPAETAATAPAEEPPPLPAAPAVTPSAPSPSAPPAAATSPPSSKETTAEPPPRPARAAPPPQRSAGAAAPAPPIPSPPASSISGPTAEAPLDFSGLETRLRETKALGVLTKLSVKNQADDLLERFRAYHKQQNGSHTLTELRRAYDMLLLKLLSLLQDGDPPLAKDIDSSRAAIWEILADPRKFIASNLMAGA
jgi:hypothetical protein